VKRGNSSLPVTVVSSVARSHILGKTSITGMHSLTDSDRSRRFSVARIPGCRPKSFSTSDWVTFLSSETRGKQSLNP
jgi:hypothetical protein